MDSCRRKGSYNDSDEQVLEKIQKPDLRLRSTPGWKLKKVCCEARLYTLGFRVEALHIGIGAARVGSSDQANLGYIILVHPGKLLVHKLPQKHSSMHLINDLSVTKAQSLRQVFRFVGSLAWETTSNLKIWKQNFEAGVARNIFLPRQRFMINR